MFHTPGHRYGFSTALRKLSLPPGNRFDRLGSIGLVCQALVVGPVSSADVEGPHESFGVWTNPTARLVGDQRPSGRSGSGWIWGHPGRKVDHRAPGLVALEQASGSGRGYRLKDRTFRCQGAQGAPRSCTRGVRSPGFHRTRGRPPASGCWKASTYSSRPGDRRPWRSAS